MGLLLLLSRRLLRASRRGLLLRPGLPSSALSDLLGLCKRPSLGHCSVLAMWAADSRSLGGVCWSCAAVSGSQPDTASC